MAGLDAIVAMGSSFPVPPSLPIGLEQTAVVAPVERAAFADILRTGLQSVDERIATADALVRSFALGDAVPLHQVTAALEEARLAVEVAMQVRTRLVETYRDFMTMQI